MAPRSSSIPALGQWRDTITGSIVVVGAAIAFFLVYAQKSDIRANDPDRGYEVTAKFARADGIAVGAQVRMSGVNIGKVVEQDLGSDFRAVLTLQIEGGVELTSDTSAAIHTDGLLGAKYIELLPGGDDRALKPGQEIAFTQDAMVLEELLDMIIQQGKARRGITNATPN